MSVEQLASTAAIPQATASDAVAARPAGPFSERGARSRRLALLRGLVGITAFLVLWELGSHTGAPVIGKLPGPLKVITSFGTIAGTAGFWQSCWSSLQRVGAGFVAALLVGIPLGLLMATRRTVKAVVFPVFEILRPIPPLAWVPLSILFWPTDDLSIEFVIFLGAIYPLVLNIVDAAALIDRRHVWAARSLGAGGWGVFRRVVLPGTLPAIATGAVIGIGITWEVVVAAELIAGGGQSATSGGIGFLLWNSYQGQQLPQVIVCMIVLGIAGYASSAALRLLADRAMPWRRRG